MGHSGIREPFTANCLIITLYGYFLSVIIKDILWQNALLFHIFDSFMLASLVNTYPNKKVVYTLGRRKSK